MDEHRHRWSTVDFFVDDGRPMIRQSCACGVARAIPGSDRSWQPERDDRTRLSAGNIT